MLRLAVLLALCASPVLAQEPVRDSLTPAPFEPPAAPGTVALRIANATDCPMAIRVKQNGEIVGVGLVKPRAIQWGHFKAGNGVFEVELIVSPRLCGAAMPAPTQSVPSPDRGTVRALTSWRVRRILGARKQTS